MSSTQVVVDNLIWDQSERVSAQLTQNAQASNQSLAPTTINCIHSFQLHSTLLIIPSLHSTLALFHHLSISFSIRALDDYFS